VGGPSETDVEVVSAAANLAGIAIERHRAEATIRDNEDRWRTLLENLQNVAVQAYEPNGSITFWNKVSERVYGYTAAEALGRDILELIHTEAARATERQVLDDALEGASLPKPEEFEFLRRDGVKITVLSSRVLHRRPGRTPEFFCFDVDVTDKKRAEEELALRQAELAHASRLSTLGQMVAALSHEVAQPLTAIGNYASASDQLLRRTTLVPASKLREYIRSIAQQSERCTAILERLRDFSRRARPHRSHCDIRQLIKTSIALVSNEIKRQNVSIRTRIAHELPLIVADRIQLQQVVVNLLTNACDAVRDQPEPRRLITIRAHISRQSCEIVVEDLGSGFSTEFASRLFEPFFTTKSEGLGIGLNICEAIVRSHGGDIRASNNQKGGATFTVQLPLSENDQT
jgi:PAS domain S-box-containing protein